MYKKLKPEIVQPDIIMYTDIVYSNPFSDFLQNSIPLSLHLLRPFYELRSWEKRPLFVWIGGGGFRGSTPARFIPELVEYAKRGYVVASIGYRVSSDSFFPSQVEDVKTAIRFLKYHHEKYGIDPERVVVAGHSAGAYLAAMVGVTGEVDMFDTDEWKGVSSSVKGVVCMSGGDFFMEDQNFDGEEKRLLAMGLFLGYKLAENLKKAKPASVLQYVNEKTPPFVIIHGEKDDLIPLETNKAFYQKLIKAGVEADFYEVEGAGHEASAFWQPELQKMMFDFFGQVIKTDD